MGLVSTTAGRADTGSRGAGTGSPRASAAPEFGSSSSKTVRVSSGGWTVGERGGKG
jgi:hypothetical protein